MADWLPWLNTALIVISGGFLAVGYGFIRARRVTAHHRSMLTAAVFAGLFLVVYVIRWVLLGSKAFPGSGAAYAVYLGILGPHVVLAIAVAPLALITPSGSASSSTVASRWLRCRSGRSWPSADG